MTIKEHLLNIEKTNKDLSLFCDKYFIHYIITDSFGNEELIIKRNTKNRCRKNYNQLFVEELFKRYSLLNPSK